MHKAFFQVARMPTVAILPLGVAYHFLPPGFVSTWTLHIGVVFLISF